MRIKLRLLVIGILLVSLAGAAGFYFHRSQLEKSASAALQRGNAAASNDAVEAIKHFSQYVRLKPKDANARARLGHLLLELGRAKEANYHLERAARELPNSVKIRLDLVKAAILLGRFSDAESQITKHLLSADESNAEYWFYHGICLTRMGEDQRAIESLENSVKLDPTDVLYTSALVRRLDELKTSPGRAKEALNQLTRNAFEDPGAFVARGRWYFQQAQVFPSGSEKRTEWLELAWEDAMKAKNLDPFHLDSGLLAAGLGIELGRAESVREFVYSVAEKYRENPAIYLAAAEVDLSLQNRSGAIETLHKGVDRVVRPFPLIARIAELQIAEGELEGAKASLGRLRETSDGTAHVSLLQASILAEEGDFEAALKTLGDARSVLQSIPELNRNANFLIARCYAELGRPDEQRLALERAAEIDPDWIPARALLAAAYLRAGRWTDAIREYELVVGSPEAPVESISQYARLLIQRGGANLDGSAKERVDSMIQRLQNTDEALLETGMLLAERAFASQETEEARRHLRRLLKQHSNDWVVWQAAIELELRLGEWEDANNLIESGREKLGDLPELRLSEARLLVAKSGPELPIDRLKELSRLNSAWTDSQSLIASRGFVRLFYSLKNFEACETSLNRLVEIPSQSSDTDALLMQLELAYNRKDLPQIEVTLEKLAHLEDQTLWKIGEAIRLVMTAAEANKSDNLRIALGHLEDAETSRPDLSGLHRIKGQILVAIDRKRDAIESLKKAIALGDLEVTVISTVYRLLVESERYVDADEFYREMQSRSAILSNELVRAASQVSAGLSDFARAKEIAIDLANRSDATEDQIWLAQILGMSGELEEASETLERVLEKSPSSAIAHLSLVQVLSAAGKRDEAIVALENAETLLVEDMEQFILGQGHEVVQQWERAEEHYENALASATERLPILRRLSRVKLKLEKKQEAFVLLKDLLDAEVTATDKSWIRRELALLVAAETSLGGLPYAKELLAQNGEPTVADRRVLATILAYADSGTGGSEAIEILTRLIDEQEDFSFEDNLLLAKIYANRGEWHQLPAIMKGLITRGGSNNAQCVQVYVQLLMETRQWNDAQIWLDRYANLIDDNTESHSRINGLQARLYFHAARYDDIIKLVKQQGNDSKQRIWAANAAEFYRDALRESGTDDDVQSELAGIADDLISEHLANGGDVLPAASYFARQGRMSDVLNLDLDGIEATVVSLSKLALASNRLNAEDTQTLLASLKNEEQTAEVLLGIGDANAWIGRWREATVAYEKVLKEDPGNLSALNNMAFVLSLTENEEGSRAQAAIERISPTAFELPVVMDTRGLVLMKMGKLSEAEEAFESSLDKQFDAGCLVHLAVAQLRRGEVDDSKKSFIRLSRELKDLGKLHPLDRKLYDWLVDELGV